MSSSTGVKRPYYRSRPRLAAPEMDLDLPPSHHPDARIFAKALVRRVSEPIVRQYRDVTLTVAPFGWALNSSSESVPLIFRTLQDGIKVHFAAPIMMPHPFIAGVLSAIEEMLGSQQRWRIQSGRVRGAGGRTQDTIHRSHLVKYQLDGGSEIAADPRIVHEHDSVVAVDERPFTAFDPLVASVLDAKFAARTPKGEPRDWIGEMREHYRRENLELPRGMEK